MIHHNIKWISELFKTILVGIYYTKLKNIEKKTYKALLHFCTFLLLLEYVERKSFDHDAFLLHVLIQVSPYDALNFWFYSAHSLVAHLRVSSQNVLKKRLDTWITWPKRITNFNKESVPFIVEEYIFSWYDRAWHKLGSSSNFYILILKLSWIYLSN